MACNAPCNLPNHFTTATNISSSALELDMSDRSERLITLNSSQCYSYGCSHQIVNGYDMNNPEFLLGRRMHHVVDTKRDKTPILPPRGRGWSKGIYIRQLVYTDLC